MVEKTGFWGHPILLHVLELQNNVEIAATVERGGGLVQAPFVVFKVESSPADISQPSSFLFPTTSFPKDDNLHCISRIMKRFRREPWRVGRYIPVWKPSTRLRELSSEDSTVLNHRNNGRSYWVRCRSARLVGFRDPKKTFAAVSYESKRCSKDNSFPFSVFMRRTELRREIDGQLSNL